jgi:tetratricopeptide (TPR) repeat protein
MFIPPSYVNLLTQLEHGAGECVPVEIRDEIVAQFRSQIRPVPDHALVYPPIGFLPWPICSIGNGDEYGYYWPIGKESSQPVVAQMSHDYGALNPIASSIETLARLENHRELGLLLPADEQDDLAPDAEADDEDQKDVVSRLKIDESSPYLLVANADIALGQNNLNQAEANYLRAVEKLPEYTAAHFGLVVLYRRLRRPTQALKWMVEAIRSPLCFRGASFWSETYLSTEHVNRQDWRRKCLHWLQQARAEQAGDLATDPLFQFRHRLKFDEGKATNDDYAIYDEAIEGYVEQGRIVDAISLAMSSAELMMGETTPFRERSGFTLAGYRNKLLRLFRLGNLDERAKFLEG